MFVHGTSVYLGHQCKHLLVTVINTDFATNLKKQVFVSINDFSVHIPFPSHDQTQNKILYTLHYLWKPLITSLKVKQNKAMRILKYTPQTTRIVNIGTNLTLTSIYVRIVNLNPVFSVEAAGEPTLLPYSALKAIKTEQ